MKAKTITLTVLICISILLILPVRVFAADEFTIHFVPGEGGSGMMEDAHMPTGSQYQMPDCMFTAPDGMTFDMWYVTFPFGSDEASISVPYGEGRNGMGLYEAGETISIPGVRNPAFTAEARWKTKEYTVTFVMNGAEGQEPAQTVKHGEKASTPYSYPRKKGHTFVDWYSDEALTEVYDFNAPVTSDITLYAGWGDYACAHAYDLDMPYSKLFSDVGQVRVTGKDWHEVSSELHLYGEEVTYSAKAVKPGYKFRGWSPPLNAIKPTGEIVCTDPEWTRTISDTETNYYFAIFDDNCVVSFDTRGGSVIAPITADDNGKISAPDDPKGPGKEFTFAGWYTDTEFKDSSRFDFDTVITSDMTLYARYNVEIRVIPYSNSEEETNGGRAKFVSHQAYPVSGDMKTGDEGKKESIQAKAEQHYEFAGWTVDDPEGEIISTDSKYTFVIDGAHTYYAVFNMTDHIWGEWEYTIEPTATTSGIRTRTCKLNPNHTETEIAPEIGGGDDGLGPQTDNKEEVKPTDTSVPDNANDIIAKNDSPVTGDNLYPTAWICLFSVSIILGGLMIACIARRKE